MIGPCWITTSNKYCYNCYNFLSSPIFPLRTKRFISKPIMPNLDFSAVRTSYSCLGEQASNLAINSLNLEIIIFLALPGKSYFQVHLVEEVTIGFPYLI